MFNKVSERYAVKIQLLRTIVEILSLNSQTFRKIIEFFGCIVLTFR